ncbi:MAG: LysR family transcriptional regulator substrate-binding protein, partial [Gammaproteobacteria bacterium]
FLDSEKAYDKVTHGEIELAVVTLALEQPERIYSRALWFDQLSIMTSPDHALTRYKRVKAGDLLGFPAILPAETTFTRQLVDRIFRAQGLKLEVGMSTNYLETIKMMVSVGMAWSVLPQTMLDDSLRILPVENISLGRQLGYIYHRDHTLSNAARAFIQILDKYGSQG